MIVLINKKLGETPLEAMRAYNPSLKMTYAGRLDPMAEGLLLCLSGDEIAKKTEYMSLPKTYQANILLGLATDSGDLLGLPKIKQHAKISKAQVQLVLKNLEGKQNLLLPRYSSPVINGTPLWVLEKEGKLTSVPKKEMTFTKLTLKKMSTVSGKKIQSRILTTLPKIHGDFRQKEIEVAWKKKKLTQYVSLDVKVECESGSYIRSLAVEVGRKLGAYACLYSLKRTKIGNYAIQQTSKQKKRALALS